MSRKVLPLEEAGTSGSSGLFWDFLASGACDEECHGIASTQPLTLKGVFPFPALKLSPVSLEESCRYYSNTIHPAAQMCALIATPKVTPKVKGL